MGSVISSLGIEFFGAFLGFLGALIVEKIYENKREKAKKELVVKSLTNELRDLIQLQCLKEKAESLENRIPTPIWDSMKASGIVVELIKDSFFNDLVSTYSMIEVYNFEGREYSIGKQHDMLDLIIAGIETTLKKVESTILK